MASLPQSLGIATVAGIMLGYAILALVALAPLREAADAFDVGLYEWEEAATVEGTSAEGFRWTGRQAVLWRRVEGAVLGLPLFLDRPDVPGARVPVTVSIEDRVVDRIVVDRNGWHRLVYHLPSLAAVADGHPPGSWIRIHLKVHDTFVPARLTSRPDWRRLGVGVGTLAFNDELPATGAGFWGPEHEGERRFRWTRRAASLPVRVEGRVASFEARALHPDVAQQPVHVRLLWNGTPIDDVSLPTHAWYRVSFEPPQATDDTGVLSLLVDRTWNPSALSVSPDPRFLGVAITPLEWR